MNIFILDEDLEQCAKAHVDKHCVKMILESAQMLCTAHWINKYLGHIPRKLTTDEWNEVKKQKQNEPRDYPYLPVMHNHPCSIWVRESLDNYEWLYNLAYELNEEYGHRYGKSHKSMREVIANLPDIAIPQLGLTPFVQAMPEELQGEDAVEAYRRYYRVEKSRLAFWTKRKQPDWWEIN